ncbi:MAG: 16S rRNA (adenine(1518)-N(6)/adenine(1519)-N(6))-dimethyltransferase RsmA [Magnetococcales bacterium]|nr:16S rRNA (adenine(1518)-N(6)/adenine(1519)-N(6))-dimethyltransferase RsmA [Magnetococcales bacterium]
MNHEEPLPTALTLPALIRHLGLTPRREMGQNFLVDENIAEKIVRCAHLRSQDRVVEIGPGLGSLTLPLSQAVGRLCVIERDHRLLPALRLRLGETFPLVVEQADVLEFDFSELGTRLGGAMKIVGNLPYNISSPLLIHLLDHRQAIESMTLMFQKEVAQRITACPGSGNYGSLAVQTGQWMVADRLFDIGPGAFFPAPKVQSSVVHFKRRDQPLAPVVDEALFRRVVRTAFNQRRKTLANALHPMHPETKKWLTVAGIDPSRRAETLSVAEFAQLTNTYATHGQDKEGGTGP